MKSRQDKTGKAQTVLSQVESLPPVTRAEKVQNILRSVEEKVSNLIDNEEVKVSSLKVPFTQSSKDQSKELAFRIKAVQQTREKMRSRLQQITLQERQLKHKQRMEDNNSESKQRSRSPLGVRNKSKLTQEDIALLAKLKKEHKQFQKSLEKKTAEYNLKVEQLKREENQLKERQKKELTQARCKQISARLQNIAKQQAERAKIFEQEKKKIIQLKAKRKLFEDWEERQKEAQRLQMQKKITAMQQRLQKKKEIDLANLQQHEQRYQDIKAQQKAQRQRKREQLQQLSRQRKMDKFQRSKFYTLAVQQTKQRKQQEDEKQRQRAELVQAARQYAQQVKRQHAPRIKTHSSQQEKSKTHQKPQGLTFEEMKEVGNSYFQQMRKKLKKIGKNNNNISITQSHTTTPIPLNTQSTKYRDYLSQRRIAKPTAKRDKMNLTGDSRIVNRGIRLGLEEACRLAGGEQRAEGLERLRLFASRLEVQRGTDDFQLLDKITAKLHILETLSQRE